MTISMFYMNLKGRSKKPAGEVKTKGGFVMSKSMLEEKKKDIVRARKSLTVFYNDLKNVNRWEHKIYKEIFTYLEVLSTRLFYYDYATDEQIKK